MNKLDPKFEDIAYKLGSAKAVLVEYPDSEWLFFESLLKMYASLPKIQLPLPILCWDSVNKVRVFREPKKGELGSGAQFFEAKDEDIPGFAAFRKDWEKRAPVNLMAFLKFLTESYTGGGLFVILDFDEYLNLKTETGTLVRRQIKNLIDVCLSSGEGSGRSKMRVILASSNHVAMPDELRIYMDKVVFELPKADAIAEEVEKQLEAFSGSLHQMNFPPMSDPVWETVIRAGLGLTLREFGDTFREYVLSEGGVNKWVAKGLYDRKVANARESGLTVPPEPKNKVGGLENLQKWIDLRAFTFFEDSDRRPTGLLAVGPPGTGKSQVAKVIAMKLGLTIFSLQPDAIFGSLVGESEGKLRKILQLVEANSPCILWIDEIEQMFSAGAINDVSNKVTGMLLSWMNDQTKVLVIATSNDPTMLPPQMLRKGRFDEIFFVDLPGFKSRMQIFQIHIARFAPKVDPKTAEQIAHSGADKTKGWSGAEIEAAVKSAEMASRLDGNPESLDQFYLGDEIRRTKPLIETMPERIEQMREISRQFVPASDESIDTESAVPTPNYSRGGGFSIATPAD